MAATAVSPASTPPTSLIPRASIARKASGVDQLGPNALGEVLEPGKISDCYLGLLLPPPSAGEPEAGTILIVAPAALPHPAVPQPAGSLAWSTSCSPATPNAKPVSWYSSPT